MSLKTQNLTFGRHISVDEVLHYSPHPTDPNKTLLKQEATVKVHGVPLSYYMEDMITTRISSNASKGRQGLEWVITKINSEVKFLPYIFTISCNMYNRSNHFNFVQVKGIADAVGKGVDAVSKGTDDIISHTHKSIDDMTETARKSMDEMSTAAKKNFNLQRILEFF